MKSKVVVIGTGGTIASRYDAALGRKVAAVSGSELVAMLLPGTSGVAELEVDNFATILSFHMDAGSALWTVARRSLSLPFNLPLPAPHSARSRVTPHRLPRRYVNSSPFPPLVRGRVGTVR